MKIGLNVRKKNASPPLFFFFNRNIYAHIFIKVFRALLFSPFLEYCGHMSCEIVYASSTHALYNWKTTALVYQIEISF